MCSGQKNICQIRNAGLHCTDCRPCLTFLLVADAPDYPGQPTCTYSYSGHTLSCSFTAPATARGYTWSVQDASRGTTKVPKITPLQPIAPEQPAYTQVFTQDTEDWPPGSYQVSMMTGVARYEAS